MPHTLKTQERYRYRNGRRISPRARVLLLCACVSYLFLHAIVPAGFMPAKLSSGLVYQYCYGDSKSVDFLRRIQQSSMQKDGDHSHHNHHHHDVAEDENTLEKHLGDHCGFASLGFALVESQPLLSVAFVSIIEREPLAITAFFTASRLRNSIQARAPPSIFC